MAEGIITLGIGSAPDGLLWFFTLGLEAGAPTPPNPARIFLIPPDNRAFSIPAHNRTAVIQADNRVYEVQP